MSVTSYSTSRETVSYFSSWCKMSSHCPQINHPLAMCNVRGVQCETNLGLNPHRNSDLIKRTSQEINDKRQGDSLE